MYKKLTIFGIISSLLYVTYVVLGGFLWKGYSHLMQPISDLTAKNAPNGKLISAFQIWISILSFRLFTTKKEDINTK